MVTNDATFITLRSPCSRCEGTLGYLSPKAGQNCVYCSHCNIWLYNAPKTETGERQRSVSTVHNGIKPGQRVRIIERAASRCELCGTRSILHVGHVVSVKDGLRLGLTETELNHDDNLVALCEECNLGMGSHGLAPRLYAILLQQRGHDG